MPRSATVLGHGTARAVPDSAVVRVAAAHRAPTVAEAVAGVDSAVTAIGRVARGMPEVATVSTTGMSVWPVRDPSGERVTGFEATHQLGVRCPNLPVASALLVGLAEEVGDRLRVEGVQLEVADETGPRDEAREAAYRDARRRALHLAEMAGAALGDLLEVVEEGAEAAGPGIMLAATLEPGETTVAARVRVTWQLL